MGFLFAMWVIFILIMIFVNPLVGIGLILFTVFLANL